MSVSAVFKLPPHKSPVAIGSCILGLLHRPASGLCSRWRNVAQSSLRLGPPSLPHCTAKCLMCRTFRRAPACNSHTSSSLGGQDMPSSPSSAWKQHHGKWPVHSWQMPGNQKGRYQIRTPSCQNVSLTDFGIPKGQTHQTSVGTDRKLNSILHSTQTR